MSRITISEALKEMEAGGGVPMFIPSIGRKLLFKRMTTGTQKTLGRMAVNNADLYHNGVIRLALFDDLLLEGTKEYRSSQLKTVDVVAFIAQLKMQSFGEDKAFTMAVQCPSCGTVNMVDVDMKRILENCGKHEFRSMSLKMEGGTPSRTYEFVLCEPTYLDTLILMESMRRSDADIRSIIDAEFCFVYNKLCLYIDSVSIDGKDVEGDDGEKFSKIPIVDRLRFFDSMDQRMTVDEGNKDSLVNVISAAFPEDVMTAAVFDGALSKDACESSGCGVRLKEVASYDAFFTA